MYKSTSYQMNRIRLQYMQFIESFNESTKYKQSGLT